MKSSRTGAFVAIMVFCLVAAVVIGGMTWASVAQLRLAEKQALDAHDKKLLLALSYLDSSMIGILAREAARDSTDYVTIHAIEPDRVYAVNGSVVENATAELLSPIARSGPPYEWIELYFQVDEDGDWSSPMVRDDLIPSNRAGLLRALERSLSVSELEESIAAARDRDAPYFPVRTDADGKTVQIVHRKTNDHVAMHQEMRNEYLRRSKSKVAAQVNMLPSAQCVLSDEERARDLALANASLYTQPTPMGVTSDQMAAFWVDLGAVRGRKLAVVRTAFSGDNKLYQGFVVDWSQLKPELLSLIDDQFPLADLEPLSDHAPIEPGMYATAMTTIPARLVGFDVADTGVAMARRSVMGVLLGGWATALAILALAGIGVRNLVALTNRRLQFAYAVTHELRTPLTTFRLYADMLAAGLVPEEKKQEYLETLDRESQRLSTLVQDVLEYARLENQKVRLNPTETDAPALLARVEETLKKSCEDNGVRAEATNSIADRQTVKTDLDLVNQIAGVLVDNAARHARFGKVPTVAVTLSGSNGHVHLDVVDSGPGIDHKDARAVFKPFRRGSHAEASAQRGIGLGLALARNWATLLGGRLELVACRDSGMGGAHFRLTIPSRIDA